MRIYLKGYYGYKNFGDELLLFGVIKEIFSRYQVESLVIEVGDKNWIHQWIEKNKDFIDTWYQLEGILVDWEKISFFSLDDWMSRFPRGVRKIFAHMAISLGFHPYKEYFKIFGGGEVIDETRNFPHNGWNIPLLYGKTILEKKYALWGGIGSQKKQTTHFLSTFLISQAESLLFRDIFSFSVAEQVLEKKHIRKKAENIQDFSTGLLNWVASIRRENTNDTYHILNLSPTISVKKSEILAFLTEIKKRFFFPCDLNFDLKMLEKFAFEEEIKIYDWSEHTLEETLYFIRNSSFGLGSRLHFLYCCKIFGVKFLSLSESNKLKYNLG